MMRRNKFCGGDHRLEEYGERMPSDDPYLPCGDYWPISTFAPTVGFELPRRFPVLWRGSQPSNGQPELRHDPAPGPLARRRTCTYPRTSERGYHLSIPPHRGVRSRGVSTVRGGLQFCLLPKRIGTGEGSLGPPRRKSGVGGIPRKVRGRPKMLRRGGQEPLKTK